MIYIKSLYENIPYTLNLLAHLLANKIFIFFQTIIIYIAGIFLLYQNINNIITCRIELFRIYPFFFFNYRERLDAVLLASTSASASKRNNTKQTVYKKITCELVVA